MKRRVQKVENLYILKKKNEVRLERAKMIGTFICRMVTVGACILALIAVAGDGPLMIERRLMMLAAALILMPIACMVEKRLDTNLPFDKYFEEE